MVPWAVGYPIIPEGREPPLPGPDLGWLVGLLGVLLAGFVKGTIGFVSYQSSFGSGRPCQSASARGAAGGWPIRARSA